MPPELHLVGDPVVFDTPDDAQPLRDAIWEYVPTRGLLVRARLGDRSRVRALIKAAADSLGVKVAVSAGYGDWGEGDGAHGPERDGADYFEVTVTG